MALIYKADFTAIPLFIGFSVTSGDTLFIATSGGFYDTGPGGLKDGVYLNGAATLHNLGTISVKGDAVYIRGAGVARLSNLGTLHSAAFLGDESGVTITATSGGASITNHGVIFAASTGVTSRTPAEVFIENSGEIVGKLAIAQALGTIATKMTIVNTGALLSTQTYAVKVNGATSVSLSNSGLVEGAVEMRSDGISKILNSGTIQGDVFLLDLAGGTQGSAIYQASGNGIVLGGVSGDAGADLLSGALARDQFFGGLGNDTLRGYGGSDALYGGDGADRLRGGADDDVLQGGLGADWLSGGLGEDVFLYTSEAEIDRALGIDTINGFVRGEDVIDLSALTIQGRFIGTRKFNGDGGFQVREVWNKKTKIGILQIDYDGNRTADTIIVLTGQTGLLAAADLLL